MLSILLLGACAEAPPAHAPDPVATAPGPECAAARAVERANAGDALVHTAPDEAGAAYEEALKLDPANHRIAFKLAVLRRKQERWGAAAKALARAVELAPGFASYWLELGYAREMLARHDGAPWVDAKAPLERCVALDPNLADCHVELGNVLLRLDDERGALASYTRGVERDPTRIADYNLLAALYMDVGRMDDSATVLAAARPFMGDPRPDRALYNLHVLTARIDQVRGDLAKAAAELEAARAAAPADGVESILILWNLGTTYAMMRPPRAAEAAALLKGFVVRACQSSKAAIYRAECGQAQVLIPMLGAAGVP